METRSVRPFPAGTIVSMPATIHVPGDCLVTPRVASPAQVRAARDGHGARIAGWMVDADAFPSTELWKALDALPVRARVRDLDPFEDPVLLESVQDKKPFCVLLPEGDLFRAVNFLTSLGIPVGIDASAPVVDADGLARAVEHYLHAPTLATPIEPFHGLLLALSAGVDRSLWELESEEIEVNFHLTEQDRVTLSARWEEAGRDYGSAYDPWEDLIQSDTYASLSSLPVELLGAEGPCATCEHFGLCQGFLRAVHPERPCDAWQAVFATLKQAVVAARDVLRHEGQGEGGAAR